MIELKQIPVSLTVCTNLCDATITAIIGLDIRTIADLKSKQGKLESLDIISSEEMNIIKKLLAKIERRVNDFSADKADTYHIKTYKKTELEAMDELNKGDVLLLQNPAGFDSRCEYKYLRDCTIAEIKYYLRSCMPNGRNALSYYIGKSADLAIPRILYAIDRYTEQIERQASEISIFNPDENLFLANQELKMRHVREYYEPIVRTLINDPAPFIWAYEKTDSLTLNQKKKFQSSLYVNDAKKLAAIQKSRAIKGLMPIQESIITTIANYTTLSELSQMTANQNYTPLVRRLKKPH